MVRKALRLTLRVFFYGLIVLFLLEIALRMLGYNPLQRTLPGGAENGRKFDPDLGWVLVPGHYEVGPFNSIGDSMSITIKQDTGRVTRNSNARIGAGQITFLGGSFIMGHALDNDETAVWKLQDRFPHINFRNLAVSAFGTYQSLLVLEKELERGNQPTCVIYGAIQHHELRNVADGAWLMDMNRKIPFVTLANDSTFSREGLTEMKHLFFTRKSATTYLAEKTINKMLSYPRVRHAREVSFLIIKEMQRLCAANQIAFYVAPLHYDQRSFQELIQFLEANEINYINCNVQLTPENIIKDDGHPGPEVNDIWVDRIANRLAQDHIVQ